MDRLDPRGVTPSSIDGEVLTTGGGVARWAPPAIPAPEGAEPGSGPVVGDNGGVTWTPPVPPTTYREVLMVTGSSPPEPLLNSDETDWLYGKALP